ncbi:hypothetical protein PRO82_001323 [Candidatus Protochlamydia amoebophila]|nr:hypothetical protein [Candidatus Protochlamydia amoebophila]
MIINVYVVFQTLLIFGLKFLFKNIKIFKPLLVKIMLQKSIFIN